MNSPARAATLATLLLCGCAAGGSGLAELRQGDADYEAGRLQSAGEHYGRALDDLALTPEMVLHARLQRAEAELARRRYDAAVEDFSGALQTPHGNPSEILTRRGMALLDWRYYERAAADFDAALRWTPEYPPALAGLAQMNRRRAMPGAEFAALQRLRAVAPRFASTYVPLGNYYLGLGQDSLALQAFDTAVRLEPDRAEARAARGRANFILARYEQAVADLEASLARDERARPFSQIWLYFARERLGREGETALRAAMGKLPEHGWPEPVMSFLLGETGAEELARVASQAPSPAAAASQACEAETYLGEAMLGRGDASTAALHFQRAHDTCPRDWSEFMLASAELRKLSAAPAAAGAAPAQPPPAQ
ncbi:MAG TPA: hypothetical protein VM074_10520 [Solimonas sp.]|nr:hypothetical protein [Solimonas sp.]